MTALLAAAKTFNPANEFELKQWVSIHLGPIDLSINKAVVYLAISALLTIALGLWLTRLPIGADHLGSSGLVALAHSFRGIGVIVVLAAVTVASRDVGIAALAVYALAYSLSLGVSLVEYFGGEKIG